MIPLIGRGVLGRVLRASVPVAGLLLSACGGTRDQDAVVARVGDATLTQADLESQLSTDVDPNLAPTERLDFVEKWVQKELLYQEALARKLDQNPQVRHLLEQSRRDVLVGTLLTSEFEGQEVPISESAVQEYYEQHRSEFVRNQPQIHARHILLGSLRDANAALQALNQGRPFEEVARLHSLDQETQLEGGDLGYFSVESNAVMWELCQSLPLQLVSRPMQSPQGYHLIQVLDRQELGSLQELEQARPQIVETLVHRKYQERLDQLITRLKAARKWAINDQNLAGAP
jgi:peptidyl-prolyl cis-trans isomerase C